MKVWWLAIVTGLLFGTSGCGKRTSGTDGNVVLPSPTPTPSLSPSPSPPPVCALPLSASLTVVTAAADIKVGVPIILRVDASRCEGDQFHIEGTSSTQFFDSFITFTKTYTTGQMVTESLVLEVWDPNILTAPAETRALSVVFTVIADPPPPPPPALSCTIDRIAGQVITKANDPISVVITVQGAPSQVSINGVPVTPGAPFSLSPQAPGSGTYVANGLITLGTSQATCSSTFLTPLCEHEVISTTTIGNKITLVTETVLMGPVMQAQINGQTTTTLPVPPDNILRFTNNNLPYNPGTLVSRAKLFAPFGDTVECSDTYKAKIPLDGIYSLITPYLALFGFTTANDGTEVVMGFGAGASGSQTWTYRTVKYYTNVVNASTANFSRVANCLANEVVVGKPLWPDYASSASLVLCAPLRSELRLRNPSLVTYAWGYNVYNQCPGKKVMTGMLYAGSTMTLYCSEIYQP